ncbi:HTH-like domain-containing protein [Bifidobacterium longum]|uniref:HTH-like domain-containing protein n=1 Tax=Bifidobacterium longum TaxID=216816 RepID=A0AA45ZPR7_BIFLN|nr:HTH-like domain-containing protein [Bifidobacterium longum]VEG80324.1 integrase, catalytic region [Bifidobacterium longum]
MLEHPEAERADPYEKDVERVWRDSGKVYGARKIRHALGHEGVTLSRRRINRIMKGNGMAGSYSKAAYRPRPARPDDDPAPNILAREFNGYAPRTLYLVKSVFRVSSLIFFGFRHEECRPVVCFTGCPSCRT